MQENANNNEDEWEQWEKNEAENKKENQTTTDLESSKLSCETETVVSNKYESANQQKAANLDLEKEEVHQVATADEPIAKSEIEQKDDGDLEEQQDNDQVIDMQLKQHNGLESILKDIMNYKSLTTETNSKAFYIFCRF